MTGRDLDEQLVAAERALAEVLQPELTATLQAVVADARGIRDESADRAVAESDDVERVTAWSAARVGRMLTGRQASEEARERAEDDAAKAALHRANAAVAEATAALEAHLARVGAAMGPRAARRDAVLADREVWIRANDPGRRVALDTLDGAIRQAAKRVDALASLTPHLDAAEAAFEAAVRLVPEVQYERSEDQDEPRALPVAFRQLDPVFASADTGAGHVAAANGVLAGAGLTTIVTAPFDASILRAQVISATDASSGLPWVHAELLSQLQQVWSAIGGAKLARSERQQAVDRLQDQRSALVARPLDPSGDAELPAPGPQE